MTEENDLYPRLLLLQLLSPFLGTHIERQFKQNDSKSSSDELRRSFLECISYLCDYEKGGATVTAAALQKLDYSNFLWLASNEGVKPNVEEFVLWVLERLKDITPDTQESIKRDILRRAVKLAAQRMEFYRTKMVEFSKRCRTLLKAMDSDIQGDRISSRSDYRGTDIWQLHNSVHGLKRSNTKRTGSSWRSCATMRGESRCKS